MKLGLLALALCLALPLTGCASLLNQDYLLASPHNQHPTASEDSSTIRVKNYQELVNAILFLVSQGEEHGKITLHDYNTRDVDADLSAACNEVHHEDPLGAYAVDNIKVNDFSRIVTYYEATLTISYKRTLEQIKSIVTVTGSSAIRSEVRTALKQFSSERVLRVSYFNEDADYIAALAHQAYYDTPETAFGMPKVAVSIYPEPDKQVEPALSGRATQRIVEILLTYPDDPEALRLRSAALETAADALLEPLLKQSLGDRPRLIALFQALRARLTLDIPTDTPTSPTPYAALVEGRPDSEGLALAFKLLCDQMGVECTVVEGQLDGTRHLWTIVTLAGEHHHVDPSHQDGLLLTDTALVALGGYTWSQEEYPPCGPPLSEGANKELEITP